MFVRLGRRQKGFKSWKTWRRGTPGLAVEIVSDDDRAQAVWKKKLKSFSGLGVRELVRFDPANRRRPLRIWDRIAGDLVERRRDDPAPARCETLDAYWQIVNDAELGATLRVSSDAQGEDLWPTADEHARQADERARHEARGRAHAERLVRKLRAELAKRSRKR
jgi:hypothetical protein